jgi:hypothetical protein
LNSKNDKKLKAFFKKLKPGNQFRGQLIGVDPKSLRFLVRIRNIDLPIRVSRSMLKYVLALPGHSGRITVKVEVAYISRTQLPFRITSIFQHTGQEVPTDSLPRRPGLIEKLMSLAKASKATLSSSFSPIQSTTKGYMTQIWKHLVSAFQEGSKPNEYHRPPGTDHDEVQGTRAKQSNPTGRGFADRESYTSKPNSIKDLENEHIILLVEQELHEDATHSTRLGPTLDLPPQQTDANEEDLTIPQVTAITDSSHGLREDEIFDEENASDLELYIEEFRGRVSISESWDIDISRGRIPARKHMTLLTKLLEAKLDDKLPAGKVDVRQTSRGIFWKVYVTDKIRAGVLFHDAENHLQLSRPLKHDEGDRSLNDEEFRESLFSSSDKFIGISNELARPRAIKVHKDLPDSSQYATKSERSISQLIEILENEQASVPYALDLDQLKRCQQAGPVLIAGGAGSGKTTIGIYRLLAPLHTGAEDPPKRAYLTYTERLKSSAEDEFTRLMESRGELEGSTPPEFLTIEEVCQNIIGNNHEFPTDKKVGPEEFKNYLREQHFPANDIPRAFEEYRGVLKSHEKTSDQMLLSLNDYKNLQRHRSLFKANKDLEELHRICNQFEKYKRENNNLWDDIDLVRRAVSLLGDDHINSYDELIIDETQDLTVYHIRLIAQLCKFPEFLYLTGDDQQIIFPSRFQWDRTKDTLRSVFIEKGMSELNIQGPHLLKNNYRCSKPIVNLSNRIWNFRQEFVKNKLYERRRHSSQALSGLRDGSDIGKLGAEAIIKLATVGKENRPTDNRLFTPDLMIITDPSNRSEAELLFGAGLVFTVEQAKGLESTWVILWKLFDGEKELWKLLSSDSSNKYSKYTHQLEGLLNRFNVVTSRGKDWLCFADNWIPEWSVLSDSPFLDLNNTNKYLSDIFAIEPGAKSFLTRAHVLEKQGQFRQAATCYSNGGDDKGRSRCEGLQSQTSGKFVEAAVHFLEADEYELAYDAINSKEAKNEKHPDYTLNQFKIHIAHFGKKDMLDMDDLDKEFLNPRVIGKIPGCATFIANLPEISNSHREKLLHSYIDRRSQWTTFMAQKLRKLHQGSDDHLSALNRQLNELKDEFNSISGGN